MEAELPGEKSRMALVVLADGSAFLQLPTAEIPVVGPPDLDTFYKGTEENEEDDL
jgi:hypothetical protein